MALISRLEPTGLVVTRATGVLTASDLTEKQAHPTPELLDLREIEDFAVTAEGIRELAEHAASRAEQLAPGRLAVLVASDTVFGMFRMLQALLDGTGIEIRVFRDPAQAYAWLGSPSPEH